MRSEPSFIPDSPTCGQSDVFLVRTADQVWPDVQLGASPRFRALYRAVSGTRAKSMCHHSLFLEDHKCNQPSASCVGHFFLRIVLTRTTITNGALEPDSGAAAAAAVLWRAFRSCPETGLLALRTRKSDQLWTGCPEESLVARFA